MSVQSVANEKVSVGELVASNFAGNNKGVTVQYKQGNSTGAEMKTFMFSNQDAIFSNTSNAGVGYSSFGFQCRDGVGILQEPLYMNGAFVIMPTIATESIIIDDSAGNEVARFTAPDANSVLLNVEGTGLTTTDFQVRCNNSAGVIKEPLYLSGDISQFSDAPLLLSQVALRQTDTNGTGVFTDTEVFNQFEYHQVLGQSAPIPVATGMVIRTTPNSLVGTTDSLVITSSASSFTGILSTGNLPVMAGWAFQTVPSSILTTIYTSPDLALGVYLVTACVQVSTPTASVALDTVNIYFIDEGANQVPAGFSTYDGAIFDSNMSVYTTNVTTFFHVTSAANNFFTIKINCKSSDNLPYDLTAQGSGLGDGGVKYMKIA
jgi:hypothetical protein